MDDAQLYCSALPKNHKGTALFLKNAVLITSMIFLASGAVSAADDSCHDAVANSMACVLNPTDLVSADFLEELDETIDLYRQQGHPEDQAVFYAINLQMLRVRQQHNQRLDYLRTLWETVKRKESVKQEVATEINNNGDC
jgi:hypothetical protein